MVDVEPVPPLAMGNVPVTPEESGSPVAFDRVTEEGVPNAGVTNVGLLDKTLLPEPVEEVTPVPPLTTGNVPVTPVVKGNPVTFVITPDAGVPNTGAVKVGLFNVAVASVGEIMCVFCCTKFVPSLHTVMTLPAGMSTPVPFVARSPMLG